MSLFANLFLNSGYEEQKLALESQVTLLPFLQLPFAFRRFTGVNTSLPRAYLRIAFSTLSNCRSVITSSLWMIASCPSRKLRQSKYRQIKLISFSFHSDIIMSEKKKEKEVAEKKL